MKGTKNPRVKICCISSVNEALLAIRYGASALGLVSKMPSGPGVISDECISLIAKLIPPPVASFLLTCETNSENIVSQQRKFKTNTLQLVDEVEVKIYDELKEKLPGISIVQVVHVTDESSIDYALKVSEFTDAILLDSGNPNLKIKELGGTGRVHNWEISRKICEAVDIPVFLAGGLNPQNVREAIETVEPFGVDLCSGVRSNGKLDEIKLKKFFEAVRA
ncbi:MAG: phosphoribosylanthranilate isomerase [Bacteroidota bacterium]|nr:phosphoribosylanthranilate isomerase [Bacteroidota bacterium]